MANQIKFTVRQLDRIKAASATSNETYRDSDCRGLTVVKYAKTGDLSFVYSGRIRKGKKRDITMGRYPSLSIDEARSRALVFTKLYRDGIDPVEQEADERQAKESKAALDQALLVSLQEVLEKQLLARQNKATTEKDKRNTFDVCFGDWLGKPVRSITRQMVEERYTKLAFKEGKKAQASKAMRYLSGVMNYAKAEEVSIDGGEAVRLIDNNPVEVLSDKKIDRKIKPRSNYLTAKQIASLLEHLMHHDHPQYIGPLTSHTIADYLTVMLFTGVRRREAASLKWDDVDLTAGLFTLHDTKNGEDFVVPMSSLVKRLFQKRFDARKDGVVWVFPARNGEGHLVEPSKAIGRLCKHLGFQFSSHTLRHTFASFADAQGIDWAKIKGMLNHKANDITAVYVHRNAENLRPYFDEVMNAMMIEYQGFPEDGEWVEVVSGPDDGEGVPA